MPVGTLVGIAISDKVNGPYIYCSELNRSVINIVTNNAVTLSYETDELTNGRVRCIYDESLEKSYLVIPNSMKNDVELTFNLGGIYDVSYDVELEYSDDVYDPTFYVNNDFITGNMAPQLDGVKEITVYTDSVMNVSKDAEKLGYNVSIPSQLCGGDEASMLTLYMLSVVVFVALVIMFYISFAILQRVYLTKTKDYSIFRTLGLVSRDLKKVLYVEVMAISIVSTVLGAIIANAIIIIAKLKLVNYYSVLLVVIYVIAMTVFGFATAVRLNSRIFKNSVYQSLKEGGQ